MGRFNLLLSILALATVIASSSAYAIDPWDSAVIKDNTAATTNNEMGFGQQQVHDLEAVGGVADEDWFIIGVDAFRSYQITVSQATGGVDMTQPDFLQLYDAAGTTLLQGQGGSNTFRIIRWIPTVQGTQRIRVKGTATTAAASEYTISFAQSALYCPRYNNAGSQISVLIVQNTTNSSCGYTAEFHDEAGNYVATGSPPAPVAGMGTSVIAVGSIPALVGTKGSIKIEHLCSPSVFKAKVVALEPSTGFSFDTLCERR